MSSKKQSRQERRAAERKLRKTVTSASSKTMEQKSTSKSSSKWYMGLIALAITFICFSNVGGLGFVNWDDDKNFSENPAVVNFNMEDFGALTSEIFTDHVIGNYNPLTIFSFAMDKVMFGLDNPCPWQDYYMDNKLSFKNIISKAHYFGLSLATGLIGIHFLSQQGSIESTSNFEGIQRLFIGSFSYLIYLVKLIVPYKLSPLYPYPSSMPWYFYASMIVLPLTIWGLWKAHNTGKKHIVFGLGVFIVNIIFLLQILGAGQGFLADRFSYIPYLGLFFILGYYFDQFTKENHKLQNTVYGVGGAFVIAMGVMTFNQNKIWKDSGTMWTHVLKYDQNTNLPYGNRANFFRDTKQYDLALADYDEAIRLKPNNPEALNSRARLYFNKGGSENLQLAAKDYNAAITKKLQESQGPERDKSLGEYYINLGATYAMLGDRKSAIEEFNRGLTLKPNHETGYLNRSVIYNQLGDYPNALKDIETYFKYNPYNADLWYESARLKRAMSRLPEAVQDYSEAIRLNGNKGVFYYERSRTQKQLNQIEAAKADLNKAIQLGYAKIDAQFRASLGM